MKKKLFYLLMFMPFLGFSQFNQGFEGATTVPTGWTVINGGDTVETWKVTDFTGGEIGAHTGTNAMSIRYSSTAHNDYLITPGITVAAGVNDQISFWARSRDPLYPETISVKVSTTTPVAASFTNTLAATVAPPSGAYFVKYTYDLSAYVGQTIYVGFHSTTTDKFYFDIDDVVNSALAACPEPNAIVTTAITPTSATVNWTSTATSFVVEYGIAGFTQGTGTIVNVTGTSTTLSPLVGNTEYVAYVKAVCSGTSESTWSSVTFRTTQPPAANDLCTTATALTVGTNFASNALTATSVGATTGTQVPTCSSSVANDVWFSLVVPANGNVTIETAEVAGSDNSDTIIAAYTGTCGSLVPITPGGCNDDNDDGLFSTVELTGLTPGATIYVGVWQYESIFGPAEPGEFQISAYSDSLGTNDLDASKFSAYPNPVTNILNLQYADGISDVAVFNVLGQQVLNKKVNASESQVDMSTLNSGAYFVKVTSELKSKTIKVLKK